MSINWRNWDEANHQNKLTEALSKKGGCSDFITSFDNLNKSTLVKAVETSDNVRNITIGPKGRIEIMVSSKCLESGASSTPCHSYSISVKETSRNYPKYFENKEILESNGSQASVAKVLAEIDEQRRQEVQDVMRVRVEKVRADKVQMGKEIEIFRATLRAQSAAKKLQAQEELLREQREEERRSAERKHQQELEQQLHAERACKRAEQILEAEERLKKNMHQKKMVDEIYAYYKHYGQLYREIVSHIKSCLDKQALKPLIESQKRHSEHWELLLQHCGAYQVTAGDVKDAKDILYHMNLLLHDIKQEVAKTNEKLQIEKQLKKETVQEPLKVEQEDPVLSVKDTTPPQRNPSTELHTSATADEVFDFVDKASYETYLKLKEIKENNEKLFEPLFKDDSLKKFRFDCQKAVNIPVNAISPVSATHLYDKLKKLMMLLSGQSVLIGDGVRVSANFHPAGIPFCKDLLAKKFVRQGASTVSSKPGAAFAIAAVIIALWQEFPDWGLLLLAHFYEECPYLVPAFWPQLEGQSDCDYYKSLGYTYSEDGAVEKQDKFLKRMSGIMRLYASLLVSRPPRDRLSRPHPHGLGQGWRWLSSLLNLEPRPDICASLIYDFLEVAGHSMFQHYGHQFQKLLFFLCKEYCPRLHQIVGSSSGPVVRLETFLQQIYKQGQIKAPEAMLPDNFW